MSLSETQKLQLQHHSVRRFLDRPLLPGQLEDLVRCGQAAASSSFIQAYSIVRVTAAEDRATIAEAAGGQSWVERAAEFLVFCADLRRLDQACERKGLGKLEGFTEHSLAAVIDVSLIAQNLLLAAESQGLGGVYIGGIRNDPQRVAELLLLPDLVVPLFGMCLGWPDESNEAKPRMPVASILKQDRYCDVSDDETAAYDDRMAAYYQERTSNRRLSDWSEASARALQGKRREHMLGFLQSRGLFRR